MAKVNIFGMFLDCMSLNDLLERIISHAKNNKKGYVVAANVHMLMELQDSRELQVAINSSLAVCPDGMPLVWLMNRKAGCSQKRITGSDLCLALCGRAAKEKIRIGFLGGDSSTLNATKDYLKYAFDIEIVYMSSPQVSEDGYLNDLAVIKDIENSEVMLLFVALGCPKQERWMSNYSNEVSAIMVGVGAVVDFLSGTKRRAPIWMQDIGLEWFYRLLQEPRRLFKRYVILNTKFIYLLFKQVFSQKHNV
jgi:N-acetylglucosaminyldiphosphoundecaprenol N-acetyl-beta-D-mannosaminyltransferase